MDNVHRACRNARDLIPDKLVAAHRTRHVGGELLATDGQASWFLLDNDLATIQDTLGAVEEAGYTVSGYGATGLTIDSKALSWLLIVANG